AGRRQNGGRWRECHASHCRQSAGLQLLNSAHRLVARLCRKLGQHGLRLYAGPSAHLFAAGGAVRKLPRPAHYPYYGATSLGGRTAQLVADGSDAQHLLANRDDYAHRPGDQERYPHRGVCQPPARCRPTSARGRAPGSTAAPAPHPDDLTGHRPSLSPAAFAQTPTPAVPQPAAAATPQAPVLTLHDALQTALKNSLDIQISQNNVEVQSLQNTLGFAGGLPTVGLNASNNLVINNTRQQFNVGDPRTATGARSTQYTVGLAGSYLLYNGGYVVANRKRLGELQQISQLQLNSTVQNVLADVSLKYYAVVQQQRYIRTLEASAELSRQKLRLIEARQAV
nr:hypothetical protein [Tanacetum cinerariifolium]